MKKLNNLESILTINMEEYEFLDNLLELNKKFRQFRWDWKIARKIK